MSLLHSVNTAVTRYDAMFICDWSRSPRLTMVTSATRGTLTIDVVWSSI